MLSGAKHLNCAKERCFVAKGAPQQDGTLCKGGKHISARNPRKRGGAIGGRHTGRCSLNGTGAAQGNSPIDVGNVTQYTLSGVAGRTAHVTVTAYDTLGRESWYSNEVKGPWRAFLPLVLGNR